MRRILIFGNSGSGKSTLAKKLSTQENSAHLDLDTLAWEPTTPPTRMNLSKSKSLIDQFTAKNKFWVIEGCYTDLLKLVQHLADEIIFLNLPPDECIANAKTRPWEPHKYESKEAQDKNINMLIDWIKQYYNRDDVFSFESHMKFYDDFLGKKRMYTTNNNLNL